MRTPGEDIDLTVRVRRANLEALITGIPVDLVKLVELEPGVYAMELEGPNPLEAEPVDLELISRNASDQRMVG